MITRTNARLYPCAVVKKHPKKLILFEEKLKRKSLHIVKNILAHRCRERHHNTLNGRISNKRNNKINLLRPSLFIFVPYHAQIVSHHSYRAHSIFLNKKGILFCKLRITWTNKKCALTKQPHTHDCLFFW